MPADVAVVISAVVAAFVLFAAVLAWADVTSRPAR